MRALDQCGFVLWSKSIAKRWVRSLDQEAGAHWTKMWCSHWAKRRWSWIQFEIWYLVSCSFYVFKSYADCAIVIGIRQTLLASINVHSNSKNVIAVEFDLGEFDTGEFDLGEFTVKLSSLSTSISANSQ